jgi:hypothetical protein
LEATAPLEPRPVIFFRGWKELTYTEAPILPGTAPQADEIKAQELTVSWEPAVLEGHEIKYRVTRITNNEQYQGLAEGAGKRKTSQSYWSSNDISENTITLDDLSSGREYSIVVLAISQKSLVYSMYPLLRVKTLEAKVEEEPWKPVTLTKHEYPEGVKGIDMALVEGGNMEIQRKLVTLDSFYMNKYELTSLSYEEIYNWAIGKSYIKDDQRVNWEVALKSDKDMPIRTLWDNSITLCNYLSIMEGLTPVYYKENQQEPVLNSTDIIIRTFFQGSTDVTYHTFYINWDADGYRLPTEAEWEYAARGGNQSKGYIYAGSDVLEEVGWTEIDPEDLRIVGQKIPNELGLYDMTSNGLEWCIDPWQDNAKMIPSHNPGRIHEYDFDRISSFGLLLKGGMIPHNYEYSDDIDPLTPQARIQSSITGVGLGESARYLTQATIRLVKNQIIAESRK